MTDILFVSETTLLAELQMAQSEMAHYDYSLSPAISFAKAINYLKSTDTKQVLINAYEKKLEAYELSKEIKSQFKGAIKVFVFLPNSNASEGSRFGLVSAEVEDEKSITSIVDKLARKKHRDYILEEQVTSLYSMHGGVGSSSIAMLIAYVLNYYGLDSLIAESSNNFSIRERLRFDHKLALLSRDLSKEIGQSKDEDWFQGFISKDPFITKLSYLNLFDSLASKIQFAGRASSAISKLATELEYLSKKILKNKLLQDAEYDFFNLQNSLKLIASELEGDSYSLFDEIIKLGSRHSQNIFFDLSGDVFTPINKQLLRFSKNLLIVFRDSANAKSQYLEQKAYFEREYKLKVIPILAPAHHYYSKYLKLTEAEWSNILGEKALVYPFSAEDFSHCFDDRGKLAEDSPLFDFADQLLGALGISVQRPDKPGLLKFLARSYVK